MDTQSLLVFQIAADVVLLVAVLFLLWRIGRNVGRAGSLPLDEQYLSDLRRLIEESRGEAARFSRTMEESCQKFKDLAAHLGEKEANLAGLIAEAKRILARVDMPEGRRGGNSGSGYEQVVKLLQAGLPVSEAAGQSGLTEGEVSLILDLEKKKRETARS